MDSQIAGYPGENKYHVSLNTTGLMLYKILYKIIPPNYIMYISSAPIDNHSFIAAAVFAE